MHTVPVSVLSKNRVLSLEEYGTVANNEKRNKECFKITTVEKV
jgi:hypothetical protein